MRLSACVLLGGLTAVAVGACGPKFEETYADGCPALLASADPSVNCSRYCDAYDCKGCPKTSNECEAACLATLSDPCLPAILACAVEHVHEPDIFSGLSCNDDHSAAFLIAFPFECNQC